MKRLLIASAAFAALAGAAVAQPAWDHSQGGPPSDYPPCTHHGEDRCQQHGGWGHHHGDWGDHGWGHHHHHHHGHSSTDGERG